MARTIKKHTSYVLQHPRTARKTTGRKTTAKGSKFPASPHQKEGKYEMSVGAQTKLKRF